MRLIIKYYITGHDLRSNVCPLRSNYLTSRFPHCLIPFILEKRDDPLPLESNIHFKKDSKTHPIHFEWRPLSSLPAMSCHFGHKRNWGHSNLKSTIGFLSKLQSIMCFSRVMSRSRHHCFLFKKSSRF